MRYAYLRQFDLNLLLSFQALIEVGKLVRRLFNLPSRTPDLDVKAK